MEQQSFLAGPAWHAPALPRNPPGASDSTFVSTATPASRATGQIANAFDWFSSIQYWAAQTGGPGPQLHTLEPHGSRPLKTPPLQLLPLLAPSDPNFVQSDRLHMPALLPTDASSWASGPQVDDPTWLVQQSIPVMDHPGFFPLISASMASPAVMLVGTSFGSDDRDRNAASSRSPRSRSSGTDLEVNNEVSASPSSNSAEQSKEYRIARRKKRKSEAAKHARERKKELHAALLRQMEMQDMAIAAMRGRVEQLKGENADLAERCRALWAQLQALLGIFGRKTDVTMCREAKRGQQTKMGRRGVVG